MFKSNSEGTFLLFLSTQHISYYHLCLSITTAILELCYHSHLVHAALFHICQLEYSQILLSFLESSNPILQENIAQILFLNSSSAYGDNCLKPLQEDGGWSDLSL